MYNCVNSTIAACGKLTTYKLVVHGKTRSYRRDNCVVYNANTGIPTSFAPKIDGEVKGSVESSDGKYLYIGGIFHHIDGKVRNYAAELNLQTGALMPWNPNPNKGVEYLAVWRKHLVAMGYFSRIGGTGRTAIASLNATTGKATNWLHLKLSGYDKAGSLMVRKGAANHADSRAVIIGNYNDVNGHSHRRITVLNLVGSHVTVYAWATPLTAEGPDTDCGSDYALKELDVTWTPNDKYFVTVSTGGAFPNSLCDTAAKWDGKDVHNRHAKPLAQQWTGGDTISAVICTNVVCYLVGHFRFADNPLLRHNGKWVVVKPCSTVAPVDLKKGYAGLNCKGKNAKFREGIMEVSVSNMRATAWNPGKSKQRGMHDALLLTPQGLWVFSDGDTTGTPKDAYGHKVGNSPVVNHNDIALWRFKR